MIKNEDFNYYSIDEEMAIYERNILAIKAVLKKYPDASKIQYKHMPGSESKIGGYFCSPSIVYDDVQIDFPRGDWYHFRVTPYVNIEYEKGIIKVHDPYCWLNFFKVPHGLAIIEDPEVHWNNMDTYMLNAGYDKKLLKPIYNKLLESLTKKVDYKVKMNPENVPDYIIKHLPFV